MNNLPNSNTVRWFLLAVVIIGAVSVLSYSGVSVYRLVHSPIKPRSSVSRGESSLTRVLFGGSSGDALAQLPVQEGLAGNEPTASALRSMLLVGGMDPKSLEALSDEELLKLYREFLQNTQPGSAPSSP